MKILEHVITTVLFIAMLIGAVIIGMAIFDLLRKMAHVFPW